MLAKRQLHPFHYCFMEVCNQVRSHVCLLPDTSIQGCYEVLWCCHPISRHQSVHKISHGNAWLRDCCRNIIVAPWATSSRQSLLITCIVKTTHLKSLPPPGPTYCRPSASNQQLSWVGFFSQSVLSASPPSYRCLTSCPAPESVKGLPFFIGIYKVFSRVLPYSAPTPIQPTLDCD